MPVVPRAGRMTLIAGPRSSAAIALMEGQGLINAPKPEYDIPRLPVDITQLDDEDLMVLYSKLTAYADFVSVQVSAAQIDERDDEKRLASMESFKMLTSEGKTDNKVTFARAQVANDPQVVEMKESLEKSHAYRKIIEVMMMNIERDAALVSRELTRRTSNISRRSNRWSA